jgi:hypothetical protein
MKILAVVETAVYVDDLDAAENFDQRILGLTVIGRSIYFRDPAKNSVELVTPGTWQSPSGW